MSNEWARVRLTPGQEFSIDFAMMQWSDAVDNRDFSNVEELDYSWVLIKRMHQSIMTMRQEPNEDKPASNKEWREVLTDDIWPMVWNWMMNWILDEVESYTEPRPFLPKEKADLKIIIDLTPDRFKARVTSEAFLSYRDDLDVDPDESDAAKNLEEMLADIKAARDNRQRAPTAAPDDQNAS